MLKSATVGYSLTKPTYTSGTGTGTGTVGESAGTGTGSTTGIGLGTSLTATTTAGGFPTTGTASLDGTATGAGFPPGSSSGGGNGVLTGNLLQKVQGPDPLGGQSGSDAGVDPNAPVKMEHDLYGMVLSWALVTAAFLTGVFSDALGSVGKAAYRATLAKIMQWREA
ncbi:MAG: hypothetical protein HY876_00005 [Coriobacteriales bacterium]|nr:hypothetical protein [Coriobacteriales bacterium]